MHEKLTIKPYIIGFALSIILTLVAFYIVNLHVTTHHLELSHEFIITVILILAVAQLFVQLFFFLHMGREQKPRWNLAVFVTFAGMILLIVLSSLWIMFHLNYNMTPMEMQQQIVKDEQMQMPMQPDK